LSEVVEYRQWYAKLAKVLGDGKEIPVTSHKIAARAAFSGEK